MMVLAAPLTSLTKVADNRCVDLRQLRRGGVGSDAAAAMSGAAFSVVALAAFLIAQGPRRHRWAQRFHVLLRARDGRRVAGAALRACGDPSALVRSDGCERSALGPARCSRTLRQYHRGLGRRRGRAVPRRCECLVRPCRFIRRRARKRARSSIERQFVQAMEPLERRVRFVELRRRGVRRRHGALTRGRTADAGLDEMDRHGCRPFPGAERLPPDAPV
jgi:hypothetical protein